jgi:hypothetical protein
MTTPAGLEGDPLARAVLAKLAETHGKDTPLGSFARTVLSGDATLREAANYPWHGEALGQAYTEAAMTHDALSPEAQSDIELAARTLAEAVEAAGGARPDAGGQARADGSNQDGRS